MSNNSTCQSQMEISKLYLILTGMILEMLRIYEPRGGTGADDIHILLQSSRATIISNSSPFL